MRFLRQLWITLAVLFAAFALSWIYYLPNAAERGIWRASTGGTIITINPLMAKMYSETSVSCLHQLSFPAHMKLVEMSEGVTLEAVGSDLHLHIDATLQPMILNRIDALPDTCSTANPDATAAEVFDTLWHGMNEHYAFFDLHDVDWDARRALAPSGDETLTDEDLFALLSQTLEGLDDGHLQLGTSVGLFSPAQPPDWLDSTMNRESLTQIARDTVGVELSPVSLTGIDYALLPDGIGYVSLRHMELDTPIGAKSEPAMAQAFAQVADALSGARAIILDVRYNPGGSDTVSFGIASHFTAQPVDVLTKTTRYGDTETAPFTATIAPFDDTPLTQPIIVLTSQMTGSAAEILTIALRELPQVTTMGQPTSGGLSDIHGVKLANGWELGLSNQTYRTMDGTSYESIGVPPDVEFEIETAPLLQGNDPLLRAALARALGL